MTLPTNYGVPDADGWIRCYLDQEGPPENVEWCFYRVRGNPTTYGPVISSTLFWRDVEQYKPHVVQPPVLEDDGWWRRDPTDRTIPDVPFCQIRTDSGWESRVYAYPSDRSGWDSPGYITHYRPVGHYEVTYQTTGGNTKTITVDAETYEKFNQRFRPRRIFNVKPMD